jgi:hypothetical protein
MKISELKTVFESNPGQNVRFVLPDGGQIPAHAHVTEAGRVDKSFVDCGGSVHKTSTCLLQTWVADDVAHRIPAGKLAGILSIAEPLFREEDLDVEIEYEDLFISQFPVVGTSLSEDALYIHLGTKHTDCLAKDVCLPKAVSCCGDTGCC